jgi:hypothetical protein
LSLCACPLMPQSWARKSSSRSATLIVLILHPSRSALQKTRRGFRVACSRLTVLRHLLLDCADAERIWPWASYIVHKKGSRTHVPRSEDQPRVGMRFLSIRPGCQPRAAVRGSVLEPQTWPQGGSSVRTMNAIGVRVNTVLATFPNLFVFECAIKGHEFLRLSETNSNGFMSHVGVISCLIVARMPFTPGRSSGAEGRDRVSKFSSGRKPAPYPSCGG